jgi:Nucleoside-diphosphate-sugar epimerases
MNIGNSREPISLKDLASLIIKILGKEDEISPKIDKKFLSTDRVSEREINNRFCDSSLAEKIIGYESLVTLEEGIRKVIDSKSISPDWMTKEKGYLVD